MGYYLTDSSVARGKRTPSIQPFPQKTHTPGSPMQHRGLRFYNPQLGRWINRDRIGERGGENLYASCRNHLANGVDPLGKLTKDIASLSGPIYEKIDAGGIFRPNSSLACKCVDCTAQGNSGCQQIECTLTAKPTIVLNADKDLLAFYNEYEPDPPGTVEQHERNHYQVWLNVYIPSYEHLIADYEGKCYPKCEERKAKLLQQFGELRSAISSWEWNQEYYQGEHKQPNIDYGMKETIFTLKDSQ